MNGNEVLRALDVASDKARAGVLLRLIEDRAAEIAGAEPTLPLVSGDDGTVFAVEQFPSNGTAYSSMHYPDRKKFPDVIVGAFHADIPAVRAQLEASLQLRCFRVAWASDQDVRHFVDATPDAHIFAPDADRAAEFLASRPTPEALSLSMGFNSPAELRSDPDATPTVSTRSYPGGYDDGPPQKRLLVPYLVQNPASAHGLHTFYCKRHSNPNQFGSMLGGNSGGEARLRSGSYAGVIVRAGYRDGQHFAVIQPIHNRIELVA